MPPFLYTQKERKNRVRPFCRMLASWRVWFLTAALAIPGATTDGECAAEDAPPAVVRRGAQVERQNATRSAFLHAWRSCETRPRYPPRAPTHPAARRRRRRPPAANRPPITCAPAHSAPPPADATYAWGQDEVNPVSRLAVSSFGMGLTLVDSLDTMHLMGLSEEFAAAVAWVRTRLRFGEQEEINVFEARARLPARPPSRPTPRPTADLPARLSAARR